MLRYVRELIDCLVTLTFKRAPLCHRRTNYSRFQHVQTSKVEVGVLLRVLASSRYEELAISCKVA